MMPGKMFLSLQGDMLRTVNGCWFTGSEGREEAARKWCWVVRTKTWSGTPRGPGKGSWGGGHRDAKGECVMLSSMKVQWTLL